VLLRTSRCGGIHLAASQLCCGRPQGLRCAVKHAGQPPCRCAPRPFTLSDSKALRAPADLGWELHGALGAARTYFPPLLLPLGHRPPSRSGTARGGRLGSDRTLPPPPTPLFGFPSPLTRREDEQACDPPAAPLPAWRTWTCFSVLCFGRDCRPLSRPGACWDERPFTKVAAFLVAGGRQLCPHAGRRCPFTPVSGCPGWPASDGGAQQPSRALTLCCLASMQTAAKAC
jgi:hypothetical protein